jgi:hypothetical protein
VSGAAEMPPYGAPPFRLMPLEAPTQRDHSFLVAADRCQFLAEYFAGRSFMADRCHRLIHDFKCRPSAARGNPNRRRRKQAAIATLAHWLRCAVTREEAECSTWIPIPPSARPGDPDFDDRLARTLAMAFDAWDVDVRMMIYQRRSTTPDHVATSRLSAAALYQNLRLNLEALSGRVLRGRIVLFDDVLTSGKHYKCCERRLREVLPSTPITGVFLMRRALSGAPIRWCEADQAIAASTALPAS